MTRIPLTLLVVLAAMASRITELERLLVERDVQLAGAHRTIAHQQREFADWRLTYTPHRNTATGGTR